MTGEGLLTGDAPDEHYMRMALREARYAFEEGEAPVGAVIVHEGRVIARAHNQKEMLRDPTAHAEMIAVTQATAAREAWRLSECVMYVTLEPCLMCAGALIQARLTRVVYGADDPKAGAVRTLYHVLDDARLNHHVAVTGGVLADECGAILSEFFTARRGK